MNASLTNVSQLTSLYSNVGEKPIPPPRHPYLFMKGGNGRILRIDRPLALSYAILVDILVQRKIFNSANQSITFSTTDFDFDIHSTFTEDGVHCNNPIIYELINLPTQQ